MPKKKSVSTNNDMSMKVILVVALALAFVGGYLVSRARYKPQILELNKMVIEKDQALNKMKANSNKVMMKDGKMYVVKDGMVSELTDEVTMTNGDKVMSDGKVMKADGSESMMQNGESMDMDGKMMMNEDNDQMGF